MTSLALLVDIVVSMYSIGLVVYSVLSWLRNPQTDKVRSWLGRFYEPVLAKLRVGIKPIRIGTTLLDLTPAVLLVGLMVLKMSIIYLLPRGW